MAVVEIDVNDSEAIENKLKRGKISGWKVDHQDGFELGGAVIGLFQPDETEFTEKTALICLPRAMKSDISNSTMYR